MSDEQEYSEEYERAKELRRQRSRDVAKSGRDIGPIADIANVNRRARCRKSLRKFCETYNPGAFKMAWSDSQLRAIARIEEAATRGALYAFAMPRGSGKTAICRMASLWAVSYGICHYVFLIGANESKACESLASIKTFIRFLDDYADDFPEVSQAVKHLAGIAHRSGGQICGDLSTMIQWSADIVVLPTVPPPPNWPASWRLRDDGMVPTSGSVICASGLTGDGIRGSLLTLTTGEMIRPDLVLLDDPQTPESARSMTQNATREQLISADILGLAGPGKSISAVMPCTVIALDDMIDRILDRKKHPLWRGERTRMLTTMPNLEVWDPYFDIYRECAQKEPPDYTEANAYYEANRERMDAGAVASWPARKSDWELSPIQHAMNLYCRDPRAFASEYQNDPLPADDEGFVELTVEQVAGKQNNRKRGTVPTPCSHLTMFVDVQKDLLFWTVCAWEPNFTGYILDYGTYPDQKRHYFTLRDAKKTLGMVAPGSGMEGAIFAGLTELAGASLGREWERDDGVKLRIERCLVDANWTDSTAVVFQFARQSVFASSITPSRGKGVGASMNPMNEWPVHAGERKGFNWRLGVSDKGARQVIYDTNFWKTFIHARLAVAMGDKGCLSLFGDRVENHRCYAEHVTAEFRVKTKGRGRELDEWKLRVGRENHWLDCLAGNAVAASMLGVTLAAHAHKPKTSGKTLAELYAEAKSKEKQGGR